MRRMWVLVVGCVALATSAGCATVPAAPAKVVASPLTNERPDRDHDGISDADDLCPDEPESIDGFADGDGCPEFDCDDCSVVSTRPVMFFPYTTSIPAVEIPILEDLVKMLLLSPCPELVAIVGHDHDDDDRLADRRADVIWRYLVSHGVSPSRLEQAPARHGIASDGVVFEALECSCCSPG